MKHDPQLLDAKVEEITGLLGRIQDEEYWRELIGYWRHPGWTTPAEWILVAGQLDSLTATLNQVRLTQETLMEGARAVQG